MAESSIENLRAVLKCAKYHGLIQPTNEDNLAVKKCVNVANKIMQKVNEEITTTVRDVMISLELSESTSRNYLLALTELDLLCKRRDGKGYIYFLFDMPF